MKKRYFGTCQHFVRTHKGVPILNDVQVEALAQVKKHPGVLGEGQEWEAVRINQDVVDVYRSFIPDDILYDYFNWLLASHLLTRVRRARKISAARRISSDAAELGRRGATVRWAKYREAVERGEIKPKPVKRSRYNENVVLITAEAYAIYCGMAPKWSRRTAASDLILADLDRHFGRIDYNLEGDLVKQAYLTHDAHVALRKFAEKHHGTMGGTLSALLIEHKSELV